MKAHLGADRREKARGDPGERARGPDRLADRPQTRPIRALAEGAEKEALKALEKAKASVRAFVEHPFHIVKNLFRHRKTRPRGLAKNRHQPHVLFGLANLGLAARKLP